MATIRAALMVALAFGAVTARAEPAPARPGLGDLVVERTVMLMRHGVRPSTKFPATPVGTTREPWATWSTPAGKLTAHGADAIRLLAADDRRLWIRQGLLPETGCGSTTTVTAGASGSSRAIETGKAFLSVLLPGCATPLDHARSEDEDDDFHPAASATGINGALALKAATAALPAGGLDALAAEQRRAFTTLARITGCCPGKGCAGVPAACDGIGTSGLEAVPGDKPDLTGAFSFGSTVGQTVLLQYLEGMPIGQVGWGRASKADIQTLLRLHPVKFALETRPPYIAGRIAAPLVRRMLDAIEGKGGRLTLLFGHDTNIAAVGGFYDLHWTMADYPADDIAPGGAIGFELVRDRSGKRFVRAFQRAQFMDQVRQLTPLTDRVAPDRSYLTMKGCGATLCDLETFRRMTASKLAKPAEMQPSR